LLVEVKRLPACARAALRTHAEALWRRAVEGGEVELRHALARLRSLDRR
jgi:hypothetical protein